MVSYKIFTIDSGAATEGAAVENMSVANGTVTIQVITVGEAGRGRERGVLPVGNAPKIPCPNRYISYKKGPDSYVPWGIPKETYDDRDIKTCDKCGLRYVVSTTLNEHEQREIVHPANQGEVNGTIMAAEIGTTKAGKPKLFVKPKADSDDKAVIVFNTKIGYRGGNSHTGDRAETIYALSWGGRDKVSGKDGFDSNLLYGKFAEDQKKVIQSKFGLSDEDFESELTFAPFPGEIICKGSIAQGGAGRMGSGEQLVVVMPKGVVFRTGYSGRLYGGPSAHYYIFDGSKIIAATWDERAAADLF
jgi:hypothetical protein